jgi:hypothetical protein
MYLFYFKNYNFVIITYSRCWSKSLINWTAKIHNIKINNHNEFIQNKNICLNTYSDNEIYNIIKTMHVYIIIRNPYERLVSSIISHHNNDNLSFLEFVDTHKDWNFKYSCPLIENIVKKYNPVILKFENLDYELKNICLKYSINIPVIGIKETTYTNIFNNTSPIYELKIKNFNDTMPHYKHFYNQHIINKIYNIFKNDFDLFDININIEELKPTFTLIISSHFNNIEFIKLQHYSLNKFFKNNYKFIIFNDSKNIGDNTNFFDNDMKNKINNICDELKIECIEIPQEIHVDRTKIFKNTIEPNTQNSCTRCADSTQFMFNYSIQQNYDYLFILDSDMFFIDELNIEDYMENYAMAGVINDRNGYKYMWNGNAIFNLKKSNNLQELNWDCGKIHNVSVDVGGNTYYYLEKYNPLLKRINCCHYTYKHLINSKSMDEKLYLLLCNLCDLREDTSCNKELLINNSIIHIRGGGNWNNYSKIFFNSQFDLIKQYIHSI